MKKLSLFILGAVLSLQAHADATMANARAILHAYGIAATLSGTYTLFIYIGNYVFAGQINL